jgi:hypothetical protein
MLVGRLLVKIRNDTCQLGARAQSWPIISSIPMVRILEKFGYQILDNVYFLAMMSSKIRNLLATLTNFEENDQILVLDRHIKKY